MKKVVVEVCSGTECVMNGSMDIVESIESLKRSDLKEKFDADLDIVTTKCMGFCKKGNYSPVVRINGKELHKATSETVMAHILSITSEGCE